MSAANKLRNYTERSIALHQEYLDEQTFFEKYKRFVAWQLAYMLPFYDDLRASKNHAAAVDFVVSDLTGIGVSARDHDIARVVTIMSRMLPDKALGVMASAMKLNARVLDINLAICRALYKDRPVDFAVSETDYRSACRQASNLDECLGLVHLIEYVGRRPDHCIRIPVVGGPLNA